MFSNIVPSNVGNDSASAHISGAERQAMTSANLKEAGERQIELITLAIEARAPFETWMAVLLKRHWHCLLVNNFNQTFGKDPATQAMRTTFVSDPKIAQMRTGDLYFTGGLEITQPIEFSKRAQHLEIWFNRYLARAYGENLPVEPMNRIAEQAFGKDSENSRRLTEYFLKVASEEKPSHNNDVACGIYELLCWEYISSIEEHVSGYPIRKKAAGRIVRETMRCFEAVVSLNRPGSAKGAREYLHMAQAASLGLDDLLSIASRSYAFAAGRFNHFMIAPPKEGESRSKSITFAGLAKSALRTFMTREIGAGRTIRIPEATAKAIATFKKHIASIPPVDGKTMEDQVEELFDTLDNREDPEQYMAAMEKLKTILADAEIKMKPEAFKEAMKQIAETNTESLHAMEASSSDSDLVESIASSRVSDRGAQAAEIRDIDESPTVQILRRGMAKLPVLNRVVLSCLFPCAATESADVSWLDSLQADGHELLRKSVDRIRRGAASPVSASISVVHG